MLRHEKFPEALRQKVLSWLKGYLKQPIPPNKSYTITNEGYRIVQEQRILDKKDSTWSGDKDDRAEDLALVKALNASFENLHRRVFNEVFAEFGFGAGRRGPVRRREPKTYEEYLRIHDRRTSGEYLLSIKGFRKYNYVLNLWPYFFENLLLHFVERWHFMNMGPDFDTYLKKTIDEFGAPEEVYGFAKEIFSFLEEAYKTGSAESRILLWKLGEDFADHFIEEHWPEEPVSAPPFLAELMAQPTSLPTLDLASGPRVLRYFPHLDAGKHIFVDRSYFIEAYLKKGKERLELGDHIEIRRQDLRNYRGVFREDAYRMIRLGNALAYVDSVSDEWMERLIDRIPPGGTVWIEKPTEKELVSPDDFSRSKPLAALIEKVKERALKDWQGGLSMKVETIPYPYQDYPDSSGGKSGPNDDKRLSYLSIRRAPMAPSGFGAKTSSDLPQPGDEDFWPERMPITEDDLMNLELLSIETTKKMRGKPRKYMSWSGLYDLFPLFRYAPRETQKRFVDSVKRPRRLHKEIEDARRPALALLDAARRGEEGEAAERLEEILALSERFSRVRDKIHKTFYRLSLSHYPIWHHAGGWGSDPEKRKQGLLFFNKPYPEVTRTIMLIMEAISILEKIDLLLPDNSSKSIDQWKAKIRETLARPELKPFMEREALRKLTSERAFLKVKDRERNWIRRNEKRVNPFVFVPDNVLRRIMESHHGSPYGLDTEMDVHVHQYEKQFLRPALVLRLRLRRANKLEEIEKQFAGLVAELTKEGSEIWRRGDPLEQKGKGKRKKEREQALGVRAYSHDFVRSFAHNLMQGVVGQIDFHTRLALTVEKEELVFADIGQPKGKVVLDTYRNPLLLKKEQTRKIKPVTINLADGETALLLSGPNMGGKTTTARGIALAVLLTQAGLPIPAQVAELAVHRNIYTIFPSVEQAEPGYGYFEMLLDRLTKLIGKVGAGDLVILDEVPTGTEYNELVSIATVIIEDLIKSGATVVVTGHLKKVFELLQDRPDTQVYQHTIRRKDGRAVPNFGLRKGIAKHSYGIELTHGVFPAKITELARRYYAFITKRRKTVKEPEDLLVDDTPKSEEEKDRDKVKDRYRDRPAYSWAVKDAASNMYPQQFFAFDNAYKFYGDTQEKVTSMLVGEEDSTEWATEMFEAFDRKEGEVPILDTPDPEIRLRVTKAFMDQGADFLKDLTTALFAFRSILRGAEKARKRGYEHEKAMRAIDELKMLLTDFIPRVAVLRQNPYVEGKVSLLLKAIETLDKLREKYADKKEEDLDRDDLAQLHLEWMKDWLGVVNSIGLAQQVALTLSFFDEFTGVARGNIQYGLKQPKRVASEKNTLVLESSKPIRRPDPNEQSDIVEEEDEIEMIFRHEDDTRRLGKPLPDPFVKSAVAQSYSVNPKKPVLVITGPNSSGKTVAMFNTLVNVLAAQNGFYVSGDMETSEFDKIFAVFGGKDATAEGESYFRNIIGQYGRILKEATPNSLVILDELHGTDNFEMAAIQLAVLHYLRKLGATVLYNTHIRDGLKEAGETLELDFWKTDISFDEETHEITYHFTLSPDPNLEAESLGRLIAAKWFTADQNRRVGEIYATLVQASGFGAEISTLGRDWQITQPFVTNPQSIREQEALDTRTELHKTSAESAEARTGTTIVVTEDYDEVGFGIASMPADLRERVFGPPEGIHIIFAGEGNEEELATLARKISARSGIPRKNIYMLGTLAALKQSTYLRLLILRRFFLFVDEEHLKYFPESILMHYPKDHAEFVDFMRWNIDLSIKTSRELSVAA